MSRILGTEQYNRIADLLDGLRALAKSQSADVLLTAIRDDLARIKRYHENAQADADAGRQEAAELRHGQPPRLNVCRLCGAQYDAKLPRCPGLHRTCPPVSESGAP